MRVGTDLHLTTIRNEHAYYSCITQVMKHIPYPIGSGGSGAPDSASGGSATAAVDSKSQPLYVIGDSHCMSSAWQTISVKNQKYVLTPKLVTGLKCWHLRYDHYILINGDERSELN